MLTCYNIRETQQKPTKINIIRFNIALFIPYIFTRAQSHSRRQKSRQSLPMCQHGQILTQYDASQQKLTFYGTKCYPLPLRNH